MSAVLAWHRVVLLTRFLERSALRLHSRRGSCRGWHYLFVRWIFTRPQTFGVSFDALGGVCQAWLGDGISEEGFLLDAAGRQACFSLSAHIVTRNGK